ncbi:MAG: hypothetical protein R3C03_01415 [Pirellulaceae bacterium]
MTDYSEQKRNPWVRAILLGAWGLFIVATTAGLYRYQFTAGASSTERSSDWPAQSRLQLSDHNRQLFVFLHPKCVCSNASIDELVRLQRKTRIRPTIVMWVPSTSNLEWRETALVERLKNELDATILFDVGGIECKLFGVETSGHTMIFNSKGHRYFDGGLTRGRGHTGANEYSQSALMVINNEIDDSVHTPVFGCTLN